MPLERLKGMGSYHLGPEELSYRGNTLKIDLKKASILGLFTSSDAGAGLGENRAFDNVFQLGWDSVAKIRRVGNRFLLLALRVYDRDGCGARTDTNGVNVLYDQIFTRAVDTCTFVLLKKGDEIVMAHLDVKRLDRGMRAISEFMAADAAVSGICSYVPDGEHGDRQGFLNTIQSRYDGVMAIDRKDYTKDEGNYFGHFEIGVYCNEGATALYGDITRIPEPKDFQRKSADSYIFTDLHSLNFAIDAHMRRHGPCIIS